MRIRVISPKWRDSRYDSDMSQWSAYFTVTEAAAELGLTDGRVRRLIDARSLDADKVAGRWLITADSVHARKNTQRRRGRPMNANALWRLLDGGVVAQLLVDSDEPARHNLRVQLVHRAAVDDVYVLPKLVDRIAPLIAPGGRALAEQNGVPAGSDPRWLLDAYALASEVASLRRSKIISGVKGQPNVRLRIVDDADVSWNVARAFELLIAWLDLADDGDRAADITLNALLAELHDAGLQRFQVGNELVARASLGSLAALYNEVYGSGSDAS